MALRCLSFVILVFVSQHSLLKAQTLDLREIATGTFLSFYALDDTNESLFGYVACYERDQLNDRVKTVHCRAFDRNLNLLAQTEFKAESAIDGYYPYFNHKKELILYPQIDKDDYADNEFKFPQSRKWDLIENHVAVHKHLCFENEQLVKCTQVKSKEELENEREDHIRKHGYAAREQITILKDSTVFVNSWQDHYYQKQLQYVSNERFYKYNKKGKLLWISPLSEEGKPEDFIFGRMLYRSEEHIYFMALHYYDYKIASIFLIGMDAKTGDRIFLEDVSKNYDYFNVNSGLPEIVQDTDDAVHIIGRKKDIHGNQLGYYSFVINKRDQQLTGRFMPFESLKGDLKKINRNGKVGKGYHLELRDGFVFANGSTALITEKSNSSGFAFKKNNLKTRDLVVILLDNNFDKQSAHLVEKDKSKNPYSDLLYSEYLDAHNGAAFFYRDFRKDDETKDKNWILGINTIINGVYSNEEIPMSSDDFYIAPYRAKKGYILLREYNKETKHNQVRLERLNY